MKSFILIIAAAAIALTACNGDKDKLAEAQAQNAELRGDLRETLATQDSLFALFNDISEGMAQIKDIEKIITTPANLSSESQSRKDQISNDMAAIQRALKQRRERLVELEASVKRLQGNNSTLTKTIANLKAQIADQQTEIESLTNRLAEANIRINELDTQIHGLKSSNDSLHNVAANETHKRQEAELDAQIAVNELNRCYYAIGSKAELKKEKILETGFLKKQKIMEGDFDQAYFTRADRRDLHIIPLHSTSAKVLTNQPADSYSIDTNTNGQKVLTITDPARFWHTTNYLVVQID